MRGGPRVLLTIWAAKLAALALRVTGRAGTHVPGRIARRLHPGIIGAIRHPARVVVVTGTNGKTTVSNLLAEALQGEGMRVASNRSGSNLAAGVAMTLIDAVTWTGRSRADVAVLEMDERSAKLILPGLVPDILVCTNLTRDSIKRNAHPDYIAWVISSALPASTTLVLNADDLIASSIGSDANPRTHFAVDRLPTDGDTPHGAAVDAAICPVCDAPLVWDYWRFNHIGRAHCPNGDFRSPTAAYRAQQVDGPNRRVVLDLDGDARPATLINPNIVNVYNEVAVAAVLDRLGIARERLVSAFDRLQPPTTRFQEETVGGVELVRLLTKGLVGVACSRAFEYLASFSGRKAVVLNIDEVSERTTDVENTAWTYDADYDYLATSDVQQIVVGGVRRHDQALRLAIAGVPAQRIVTVASELATADTIDLAGAAQVFNLHSVHNAVITGTPVQARLRERLRGGAA
ncbi:MurT ligase domain-containing protein [Pseudolysinimonas kribbensis]|uniref:MurT ligase domain-containing protein n=1 Tax=Pseudolysinimonas kribbensis TaxID=433641 RepID=UPI0031DD6B24